MDSTNTVKQTAQVIQPWAVHRIYQGILNFPSITEVHGTHVNVINLIDARNKSTNFLFSSITNKTQRYTIYLFLWNALHVSDGFSAHHQKLKTVYKTSGTLSNIYYYLPLSWQVAIKVWAPDDGQRNCLKLLEHFTEVNKMCNSASLWLYLEIRLGCTDPWKSRAQYPLPRLSQRSSNFDTITCWSLTPKFTHIRQIKVEIARKKSPK